MFSFIYAKIFIFTTTLKKFQGEDMPEALFPNGSLSEPTNNKIPLGALLAK